MALNENTGGEVGTRDSPGANGKWAKFTDTIPCGYPYKIDEGLYAWHFGKGNGNVVKNLKGRIHCVCRTLLGKQRSNYQYPRMIAAKQFRNKHEPGFPKTLFSRRM